MLELTSNFHPVPNISTDHEIDASRASLLGRPLPGPGRLFRLLEFWKLETFAGIHLQDDLSSPSSPTCIGAATVTARVAWRPEEDDKKDSNANEPNAKHLTPSKICSASLHRDEPPCPRNISGVVRRLSSSISRPPPVRRPSALRDSNFRRRSDRFSGASTSTVQTEWPHELSGPGDHKALRASEKQRWRQHSAGSPPTPIHHDETRNYSRWYVSNPLHFASSLRDPPRSPRCLACSQKEVSPGLLWLGSWANCHP